MWGSQICEHNKIRSQCKECKGGTICEHNKKRCSCKECGESEICEHSLQRRACRICDPPIHPNNWCEKSKYVYTPKRSKYYPYCFTCYSVEYPDADIDRKYKMKEHYLRDELKKSYPDIKLIFDKRIDGGCSKRRPDVRIECLTHSIIIECDENKHSGYLCENKRMMELIVDLGNRPIVFLRFNPDSYLKDGKRMGGCFKETKSVANSVQKKEWTSRIIILREYIDLYLKEIPCKELITEYLFYNN